MNETSSASGNSTKFQPYLSPLAVWALSVGSAIGWGSLVVTSSSYLSQAGPMGSIIGLLIGFVMMLMVSSHYHFLSNRYPGSKTPGCTSHSRAYICGKKAVRFKSPCGRGCRSTPRG